MASDAPGGPAAAPHPADGRVPDRIVLPGRFNGPPSTAHGGYTSGVVADLVADLRPAGDTTAVEVVLRAPPPLDAPLRVEVESDGVRLFDGATLVAVGAPTARALDPVPAVSRSDALQATRRSAPKLNLATHPFPTCFGCGPDRADGDGLRLHPAPISSEPGAGGIIATGWSPGAAFAASDGRLPAPVLWAALDCPSGWAVLDEEGGPAVLARLTGRVSRRPQADESLTVLAWPLEAAGQRKRYGASAVLDADGGLVATARATWVVLDAPADR